MALKRFATTGNNPTANATAATAGIVKLEGTAATRGAIYEWDFSTAAASAPVDENYQLRIKRQTTSGTWTSATPAPLDLADPAAVCVGGSNSTGAGTGSTALMSIGVNARAGFRWVSIPDSELIIPATANNGIIMEYQAISTSATASNTGILFHQE